MEIKKCLKCGSEKIKPQNKVYGLLQFNPPKGLRPADVNIKRGTMCSMITCEDCGFIHLFAHKRKSASVKTPE